MRSLAKLTCMLLFLTTPAARAEEPVASGLLFSSKTESIAQRTTLELFGGNSHKYGRQFSISFDLSIRDAKRFGYILRLIDSDNEEASLVFVNFREDNKFYIDFNTSRTGRNVQMRMHPDLSGPGKWVPVRLEFDLDADKAMIHVDNTAYICEKVGLRAPADLKVVFGLHGINLDVPAMAIKNIRIDERSRTRYTIPLNESTGSVVHDSRGREVGTAKNPTWLITEHFNWNQAAAFEAQLTAGIAYNPFANEVYTINSDSLTTFQTDVRSLASTPIRHIPLCIDEAIYNAKTNQTYLYNLNAPDSTSPSVAILNMETLAIDRTGTPRMANRLHHHNAFFEPECDTLYLFGGYGNFSYSNELYRYDPSDESWQTVPLRGGDSVYPRFFAATGEGPGNYEMLLFGGFGNKSGRQELGGKNLYDLIAIDLKDKSARKLWEIATDSLYIPATNLVLSRDKKHFYTLIYPHHIASSYLQLCRFDIATGDAEIVSDRIPILSEEIATKAFLFWNAPMSEFVAVIREYKDRQRANIRIYTLSGPPVSARQLIDYGHPGRLTPARILLLAACLAGLAGIGFWIRRRKPAKVLSDTAPGPAGHTRRSGKDAVYLLGDFQVFDAKGADITYRFSSKLRMLLALILFHSNPGDKGITTEKLTTTLWPEKELADAKNIRGVTINHLRKILIDMRGIELACENSRWRFTLGEGFRCDYLQAWELCGQIATQEPVSDDSMDSLVRLIGSGALLPVVSEPWTDTYRHEFETAFDKVFRPYLQRLDTAGAYKKIVTQVEILLSADQLNEDLLTSGIAALKKLGRPDRATILYRDFCVRFKAALGVEYPRNLNSF